MQRETGRGRPAPLLRQSIIPATKIRPIVKWGVGAVAYAATQWPSLSLRTFYGSFSKAALRRKAGSENDSVAPLFCLSGPLGQKPKRRKTES